MKKITLLFFIAVLSSVTATAQFVFPASGPYTVVADDDPVQTISVNDAGNSSSVTSGLYNTFTISCDWLEGGGTPWSSEAQVLVRTASGDVLIDPPTTGGLTSGAPTTMTFTGAFIGDYDPDVDGTLDIELDQSFAGSDATWSNFVVTLEMTPLVPPTTLGTLTLSGACGAGADTATNTVAAAEVQWYELIYDGTCADFSIDTETSTAGDTELGLYASNGTLIANDDDGGTGLLSLLELSGQPAGTYYIAAGEFNMTFGAAFFTVSSTGTGTGDITVNVDNTPTLSVGTVENENAFTYFPNPVRNELTLSASQKDIQNVSVYNMLGQEVLRTAPNTAESVIDMSGMSQGAYFVRVTIGEVTETVRIIKQ